MGPWPRHCGQTTRIVSPDMIDDEEDPGNMPRVSPLQKGQGRASASSGSEYALSNALPSLPIASTVLCAAIILTVAL